MTDAIAGGWDLSIVGDAIFPQNPTNAEARFRCRCSSWRLTGLNRPDIRRAERRIAEQSAEIGIAITELYPHFSITGNINWGSQGLSTFSSDANGGSIGPSFRWNLLNYGRLVNNVELQREVFGELIANYRNTVLTANQEVEDSLVAFLKKQERLTELRASVDATRNALELVTIQYKEGESDFTGVFVMQRELVELQELLAETQGDITHSPRWRVGLVCGSASSLARRAGVPFILSGVLGKIAVILFPRSGFEERAPVHE